MDFNNYDFIEDLDKIMTKQTHLNEVKTYELISLTTLSSMEVLKGLLSCLSTVVPLKLT